VFGVRDDGTCRCHLGPECKSTGKHPHSGLVHHGHSEATRDLDVVQKWIRHEPHMNFGLVANQDFWVLDIDLGHDGEESIRKLEAQYGKLPPTVTGNTGGGGRHLLFEAPKDRKVRNTVNVFGDGFSGIDTRAGGLGYIVVPPSKHKSGRSYAWADGLAPDQIKMAQAPEWLLERVVQKPRERRNDAPIPVNITEHDKKRAEGMLEKWAVKRVEEAPGARGTQRSVSPRPTAVSMGWLGVGRSRVRSRSSRGRVRGALSASSASPRRPRAASTSAPPTARHAPS